MKEKKKYRNLILNIKPEKEENKSYHSSFSSKIDDKEEKKKTIKKRANVTYRIESYKKTDLTNKQIKEKEELNNNKNLKATNNLDEKNNKKKFKTISNHSIKNSIIKKEKKDDKFQLNKGLLKIQNPIIINELPRLKYTYSLENKLKKSINKEIQINILHREEMYMIEINNGLTVNELINRIIENLKIIKDELELFLVFNNENIKTIMKSYKNLNYYFKNISIKKFNNESIFSDDYNKKNFDIKDKYNSEEKILIFPDFDNKYNNLKIKDLLNKKNNYYIRANQVPKNKYNSNYNYRKEINNININSFINNINKEIEKNNLILSKNNMKIINSENTSILDKDKNNENTNKYKNIVIVEGIYLLSDFLQEIKSFLNKNEINDYNCKSIGNGKYSFGFQRKDAAYDFNKYVNMLQLVNSKFFNIKCKMKIFNLKKLIQNNNIKNSCIKKKFYFSYELTNNNLFALKNNLKGSPNSYFLNKGEKKYLINENNDIESMNEIVLSNRFKFGNDSNYVNSNNFSTIPLI